MSNMNGNISDTNPEDTDNNTPDSEYWKRHYAGVLFWPIMALLFGLGVPALAIWGETGIAIVMILLAIPYLAVFVYGGIFAFFGYHSDAKELKQSDNDYRPWWPIWMVAHFLFTPFITSPLYLVRRSWAVGTPTFADLRRVTWNWVLKFKVW